MGKLSSTGYVKSTPTEIYDIFKELAETTIEGYSEVPSEIRENLLQEVVLPCLQFEDGINYLMNGISPGYANDEMFYNQGMTFGVEPRNAVKGQVVLNFKGLAGTLIPEGTKCQSSEILVETSADVIINSTGNASVLAYTDDNVNAIPPNTVNQLVTQITGVESVNNNNAGIAPIASETIEAYKKRVYNKLQAPRQGSAKVADDLLTSISGVNPLLINVRSDEITVDNKVYLAVNCIVGGGDDYEVANALLTAFVYPKKIAGKQSDGGTDRIIDVTLNIYDNPFPISFVRPELLLVDLKIMIKFNEFVRNQAIIKGYLEAPILNYINNAKLGRALTKATLNDLVYDNLKANKISSNFINNVTYEIRFNGELVDFNDKNQLPIEYDQYLTVSEFNVEVSQ